MDACVVETLEALILRTCKERDFSPLAYTFMPDHLHLLIEGESERAHFPSFMTLLLKRTALAFQHRKVGRCGNAATTSVC